MAFLAVPRKRLVFPITKRITDAILRVFGAPFSPSSLFTGGFAGFAYDPSDYSKVWQDSARTTQVTTTAQPIGCIDDISGNGANRTQATSTNRPASSASGYYVFDGVDDAMQSTASTASGGSWTHIIRLKINGDTKFITMSASSTGAGYFGISQISNVSTTSDSVGLGSIEVGGSTVADIRGDVYTALNGGSKTMFHSLTSISNAIWASQFQVGGQNFGFQYGGEIGREILINRTLTAGEKANAIAWVEAF